MPSARTAEILPYQLAAEGKRAEVKSRIPQAWLLDEKWFTAESLDANGGVRDIPRRCGILSPVEIHITEDYDATALLKELQCGTFSAKEVTIAFCKRSAIAHQLTNCLTEIFFEDAIRAAEELDDYFRATGRTKGPLHGLPISLKDTFQVRGIASTLGYVSFLKHDPATSDSHLVTVLKSSGAVLFVKTNVPQTLMAADTVNNVFGRTLNPHKLSLGPGGSSGGEGALVGLRGSLIGVGTDIGGSCRVPALCCGVYGFRPTVDRVPYGNQVLPIKPGWPGVLPCAGPLTTSARDVELFLSAVITKEAWALDYSALPVPWQGTPPNPSTKLSIGLLLEDPAYPVSPPITRALQTAVKMLEAAGHTLSTLRDPPSVKTTYETTLSLFDLDDDETGIRHVHEGGEPLVKIVQDVVAMSPKRTQPRPLSEFFDLNLARQKESEKWHGIFAQHGYDILITPSAEHTALPHDQFRLTPYTAIWNLVDFPACTVPFLQADEAIDLETDRLPSYCARDVHRAPCSIQVVAPRLRDEALFRAVEIIEAVLLAPSDI